MLDLPRLDERQRLEQLIHRAEPAGEDDKPFGGLHEHRLARVEVLEAQRDVAVRVAGLLVRQHDAEADGEPAAVPRAAIRRLHHARATACDDREAGLRETASDLARGVVDR